MMPDKRRPILLCLDLEAGSDMLARLGAAYAKRLQSPLEILYVLPRSSSESDEAASERLKQLTDSVLEGADLEALVVGRGNVEDRIVEYVREKKVEMVILGHRHKARRERVYVGSTVKAIISLAPSTVLVIPIDGNR